MRVKEREVGDGARLEALIAAEPQAKARDRLRMVLLALRGQEKMDIAEVMGVSKSVVEQWVYRYRDGGIEALRPKKQAGRTPKLARARHAEFVERLLAGPREGDGVCTLRGKDAVRILNDEFGVAYTLNGAYELLHRLNLTPLTPRPRHEKNDPGAMAEFRASAPLLSRK
ncbi:MAG: transposase [Phycisphaerales bacterium]|nr:transposase [Phycisphaerales bacterium]